MKKRILSTVCAALLLSSCGVAKKAAYQSSIDSNDEFEIGYLTRSGTIVIEKNPIIKSYVRDGVVADRLVLPNTVKVSLATTSRTRPGRHSGTGYLHQIRAFDQDVEIPLPQRSRRGQCYVLSNRDWKGGPTNPPVKLRANEMDPVDQYGFANVYPLIEEAVDEKRVRFENTESELRRTTQNLESTMASLAGDPNLIGDECTEPPMQAIPPRPEMPFSDSEINFQVAGFCMELMTVRYNKLDVYQMLSSGQMTDLADVHQTWQSMGGVSQTPACARQLRSRLTDGLYTLLGNLGEALLGPMGRASAMEQALGSCANDAIQSCRAPLINWEQRVEAIRAAPRQAFQACRQKQGQVVGLTESKARLESELEVARATYEKAEADYAALPDKIPLSQARCP